MTITMSHAPRANFATAKMSVTIPVATAPIPLIVMLRRQPASRPRHQWRTMPACESVIDVKTPTAYSGISASTRPPNTASTAIARTASATMPVLKASRSPRNANRLACSRRGRRAMIGAGIGERGVRGQDQDAHRRQLQDVVQRSDAAEHRATELREDRLLSLGMAPATPASQVVPRNMIPTRTP